MENVPRAFSAILLIGIVSLLSMTPAEAAAETAVATQGQFAVKLAERLGIAKHVNETRAIELLSAHSINPGILPNDKWDKDKPATEKFVAQIQASLQVLLKNVAVELQVPPPPTLGLVIFEMPPAPQQIGFPADEGSTPKARKDSPPTQMMAPKKEDIRIVPPPENRIKGSGSSSE